MTPTTTKALVTLEPQMLLEVRDAYKELAPSEMRQIEKAAKAFEAGLPDAALDYIWNATIQNLQRKVEAYGADIFLASFDGRKINLRRSQDSLVDRWERVDAFDVLTGCQRIGLISRKGLKALELINWLRNHASAAHSTDEEVDEADLQIAYITITKEVFSKPLPEPAFDFKVVIEPLKTTDLAGDEDRCKEIFGRFNQRDASTCLSMLVSLYLDDEPIGRQNAITIIPIVWPLASEEARRAVGQKHFEFHFEVQLSSEAAPHGAAERVLEILKLVGGLRYIPDHLRGDMYRALAVRLAQAKDSFFGWDSEVAIAKEIMELGDLAIPDEAFDDLSLGIIRVCCGNQWGRSGAYYHLEPLREALSEVQIEKWLKLMESDRQVKEELTEKRPNKRALELIEDLKDQAEATNVKNHATAVAKKVKALCR